MVHVHGQVPETVNQQRALRYHAEVEGLRLTSEPLPDGGLMVGSSIFKRWTTAAIDLAPLPVTNRAFGGSRIGDQLVFFDRIVPGSGAAVLIWYCGSNDINAKASPADILQKTQSWLAQARASLPVAQIVIVSVIRAPQKRKAGLLATVDEVNNGLRLLAATSANLHYVDVNPFLEKPGGEAVAEYYVADQLHLTPEGYVQLAAALKPVVNTVARKSEWAKN